MIKSVLFDIGETLLSFDMSCPRRLVSDGIRPVHDALQREGFDPPPFDRYERSVWRRVVRAFLWSRLTRREIDLLGAVSGAHRRFSIKASRERLTEMMSCVGPALRDFIKTDPDAVPVLRTLQAQGLKLGIVSNVFFPARGVDDVLRGAGLLEFFPTRIYSSVVRYRKPHPEIFQLGLRAMNTTPEHAIYVGDSLKHDIRGAGRVGMRTVWLSPEGAVPAGRDRPDHVIRALTELPALSHGDHHHE